MRSCNLLDNIQTGYYFGASDAAKEGEWVWEDGSPFTFSFWGDGEPNGNTDENCLEINYYGYWNDVGCGGDFPQGFACALEISRFSS